MKLNDLQVETLFYFSEGTCDDVNCSHHEWKTVYEMLNVIHSALSKVT